MTRGINGNPLLGWQPRRNPPPPRRILPPRASTNDAAIHRPLGRCADRTQHHPALDHQPHTHGELIPPGGKLARAIQRIDQPEPRPRLGLPPRRHFFLGNYRNFGRRRAQPRHDHPLRPHVRKRHRRVVLLAIDGKATRPHRQNFTPRGLGQRGRKLK